MAAAPLISRRLREGGLRPLPSGTPITREGIRVRRSDPGTTVFADFDSSRLAQRRIAEAAEILTTAGYTVKSIAENGIAVSGPDSLEGWTS